MRLWWKPKRSGVSEPSPEPRWDHPRKCDVLRAIDASQYFTDQNDHNPLVLAECPKCHGLGSWCEECEIEGRRVLALVGCGVCNGSFTSGEVVRMWPDDREPMSATVQPNGWLRCPHCGKLFSTGSPASWTGRRHRTCGQKIVLVKTD